MANTFDVHIVSCNVGALTNDFRALCKVPTAGGGITVLGAEFLQESAGTSSLYLVDLGTAGTAVSGTIASGGSIVYAAGVPQAFGAVGTPFVEPTHYIGLKEANVGSTGAISIVSFSYVMGK